MKRSDIKAAIADRKAEIAVLQDEIAALERAYQILASDFGIEPTEPSAESGAARKKGRPPIASQVLERVSEDVAMGATISDAAKRNGVHRNTAGRHVNKKHSPAKCGICYFRTVDGKKFLASQPDCPVHGTGLGVPQEGRDRGPEPIGEPEGRLYDPGPTEHER
jgi:hypothetical protein